MSDARMLQTVSVGCFTFVGNLRLNKRNKFSLPPFLDIYLPHDTDSRTILTSSMSDNFYYLLRSVGCLCPLSCFIINNYEDFKI